MKVSELINLIPAGETQESVRNSFERYNQAIRDALRSETRFSLQVRSLKDFPAASESKIPVERKIGYPSEFNYLEIPENLVLAARLSLYSGLLKSLKVSAGGLDIISKEIAPMVQLRIPEALGLFPALPQSRDLAEKLLKEVETLRLANQLFMAIEEDILGLYHPGGKRDSDAQISGSGVSRRLCQKPPALPPRAFLYWGAIGLLARLLGDDVESLTVVTLIHSWCAFVGFHPFPGRSDIFRGKNPFQRVKIWVGRFDDAPLFRSRGFILRSRGKISRSFRSVHGIKRRPILRFKMLCPKFGINSGLAGFLKLRLTHLSCINSPNS